MSGSSPPARPLVIGIGNPFRRDDAVGHVVLGEVRARDDAGALDLIESDGEPTRLLDIWEHRSIVVVVDAVRTGAVAGTVHVVDALDARLPDRATASTHASGLGHAVDWGRHLGRLPAQLVLVGVEGGDFGWGDGLTPAVDAAVPTAAARVWSIVTSSTVLDR